MIIRRFILSVLTFFIVSLAVSAQIITKEMLTPKEKKLFDKAKNFGMKGDYNNSNKNFETLLKLRPDFVEGILRLASNYNSLKQLNKAESLFLQAVSIAPQYDPEMYYSLALVESELKKYLPAADHLDKYISMEKSKPEKVRKAMALRDNLRFIEYAINHPVPFKPQSLGSAINTKNLEYSPSIALDGSSIIFTRKTGQEDFYISFHDSTGYKVASPLFGLNTFQNEGAHSMSADGKFMVFTACDRKDAFGSCDLYYSMIIDGKWIPPVNMGHKVNSAAWDSQPTLSPDGKLLIFSSRRLGTLGGADLWMTWRNEKNAWVVPVNMGNIINTTGDDESPFLHPDGQTLYFRSNGRPGMGGYDIYYTKKNSINDEWQVPENIGYPINTEGSEGSLAVSLDGTKAYFAGDMDYDTGKKLNHLDIFSFELYATARPTPTTFVKGYVTDAVTGKPMQADITIKDLKTEKAIFQMSTDKDGFFLGSLAAGKNYACIAEQKNYVYHAENFELSDINMLHKPAILYIALQPVEQKIVALEKPKPTILQNLFFKSGSAELLPESNTEIELLFHLLTDNPLLNITITGHTDDIGKNEDNLILSEKRAQSVAQALITKGIGAKRLTAEGKGETQPIATNNTEEGRQKNRRTEFVISSQ